MNRSDSSIAVMEWLALRDHPLPGFAEALAHAAALPLGEIEALDVAQQSFVRIVAGLDDPTVLTELPRTLWHTLEACFETGLDPRQCASVLAAAHAFFAPRAFN